MGGPDFAGAMTTWRGNDLKGLLARLSAIWAVLLRSGMIYVSGWFNYFSQFRTGGCLEGA
jgi:hypothetical protein